MIITRTVALFFGLFAVGCAATPPRQVENTAPLPKPAQDGYYVVQFPALKSGEPRARFLPNGADRYRQCHASPHFVSGSVEPRPEDMDNLERLAECLNKPDVRDLDVDLIGRADARGDAETNKNLGLARAARVRDILASLGVARERMHIKSAGESAALAFRGDYSHGYDRRVDAVLTGQTHTPRGRREGIALVMGRQ